MSRERVPYLCWRDGRPRWVPSPELRARGFRGQDLKDQSGNWLAKGPAIEAAEKLNARTSSPPPGGVEGRSAKGPVDLLPPGNDNLRQRISGGGNAGAPHSARKMAALFDAYEASPHFRRLARRTQSGYRLHIKMLRAWCGDIPVTALKRAPIADYHSALEDASGPAQANAVIRTLKIALNYAVNELEWIPRHAAGRIEFAETEGRLVLWTAEEIAALVAAADALELHSIGDAVILAALTGQRQGDVLRLKDTDFRDGKFTLRTAKTGKLLSVTAVSWLTARVEAAQARRKERWPNVAATALVVCELTGAPYLADGSRFRELFRLVRAAAAGATDAATRAGEVFGRDRAAALANLLPTLAIAPTAADKRFADLRDTAVTWLFMSDCSIAEIATITGHSLRTVQEILDKHYFVRNDALATSAATKFDRFLLRQGVKW